MKLIAPIKKAIASENYTTPTAIQAQTIPAAIEGRDILGCAQTGTGKTAAFSLPILNHIGATPQRAIPYSPFVLILAPTRELAIQIDQSIRTYGKNLKFRQTLVYGGVSQLRQVRALDRGVHIVIATPGRLLDLMNQGYIKLDQMQMFVLDEADRMLDMGFLPDIKRIISKLPSQRQSLFFSATLPPKVIELTSSLLRNPESVNVTPETPSVERIKQQVMFVEKKQKLSLLQSILATEDVDLALIFTRTKRGANALSERLVKAGIRSTAIHGDKSQNARQRALEDLRRRRVQILVATDVAARGIDVDGITHVVNYDLPEEPDSYVHRIGRTGRAGNEGVAISFCTNGQRRELRDIEDYIGQPIPLAPGHSSPFPVGEESNGSGPRRRSGGGRRDSGRGGRARGGTGGKYSGGHGDSGNGARNGARGGGRNGAYGGKPSYGKKPWEKENRSGESRGGAGTDGNRTEVRTGETSGKKPYEKKPFEKKPYAKKSFDKKPYGKKPFGKKPWEKESEGSRGKYAGKPNGVSRYKDEGKRKPKNKKGKAGDGNVTAGPRTVYSGEGAKDKDQSRPRRRPSSHQGGSNSNGRSGNGTSESSTPGNGKPYGKKSSGKPHAKKTWGKPGEKKPGAKGPWKPKRAFGGTKVAADGTVIADTKPKKKKKRKPRKGKNERRREKAAREAAAAAAAS